MDNRKKKSEFVRIRSSSKVPFNGIISNQFLEDLKKLAVLGERIATNSECKTKAKDTVRPREKVTDFSAVSHAIRFYLNTIRSVPILLVKELLYGLNGT